LNIPDLREVARYDALLHHCHQRHEHTTIVILLPAAHLGYYYLYSVSFALRMICSILLLHVASTSIDHMHHADDRSLGGGCAEIVEHDGAAAAYGLC